MANLVPTEAKPALNLIDQAFKKPQFDARVADTKFNYYWPTSGTKNTTCLRYTIPHKRGPFVLDIKQLILAPEIKITNRDKSAAPPLDIKSGPCNNFAFAIFSALRISYNNVCVCKIDAFPIYNYLRMMTSLDNNDFATWCSTRCFRKEGSAQDLDDYNTAGWSWRREQFGAKITGPEKIPDKNGNMIPNPDIGKFQYSFQPHFFIGTLDHFLPTPPLLSQVDIHIELELSKPSYVFQSFDNSSGNIDINFDFERCRLFCPEIKLNDKLFLQLAHRLASEALRQFFVSTEVTTHSISSRSQNVTFDCIGTGSSPQRLVLLIQEQGRFNGLHSKNCFKFPRVLNKSEPFLLQDVKVTLNGEECEGLACNKSQRSFRDQYFRFFYLTRQNLGTSACSITKKDFDEHILVNIYDLTAATASATEYPVLPVPKDGFLRVELGFDKPTTCPLVLIAILEKQSSLTLEKDGKVTISNI